jgi:hypothetical protein
MKRRLKEPFGKAGLTVGVIALVMGLIGGAYAAGGLTKSQEKQVKKIAKKYAGKPGAAGAAGPAGPAGANGTNGVNGAPGKNGESVTITPEGECTKFSNVSGTGEACNGQTGFTETLPSEKTERGTWSASFTATATGQVMSAPISFNIPLTEASEANFIGEEEGEGEVKENTALIPSHCTGTQSSPEAVPGNLCVFARRFGNAALFGPKFADPESNNAGVAGKGGTVLLVNSTASGLVTAYGDWAVTAK